MIRMENHVRIMIHLSCFTQLVYRRNTYFLRYKRSQKRGVPANFFQRLPFMREWTDESQPGNHA